LNTYGYVEGNPLKLIDPDGLSAIMFFSPKPLIGPPRPLIGPPRPVFGPPKAGETMQQYANRLARAREVDKAGWRTTIHQNQRPTSNPESIGKSWMDVVKEIFKTIDKFDDYFSAPPIAVDNNDSSGGSCPTKNDWQKQCDSIYGCI
jgi:hypothetical protein